jgi:hypothetical protein
MFLILPLSFMFFLLQNQRTGRQNSSEWGRGVVGTSEKGNVVGKGVGG